jgi:hypothetical protein
VGLIGHTIDQQKLQEVRVFDEISPHLHWKQQ